MRRFAHDTSNESAPDVVMVLENNRYPLDSRVRKEAESLVEAGLSVEVLAPREPDRPTREVIRGVRVRRFRLYEGHGALLGTAVEYLLALFAIGALVLLRLARSREGTLHVHNPPDLLFPLLWLARLRGWRTVFDHHDDAAGILRTKLGRPSAVEVPLAWMRERSAKAADLTIATNDTQRMLLASSARRLAVVRNSPPVWFSEHRPSPPCGRARLVFLGELGVQDGVERAVEILSRLRSEHGLDAELLVIGDGPRREAVMTRARELDLADRVEITGWVAYEDVPALLASAHVGLDTAPLTEFNHGSTMIKILEYLAVGLPVVASALHETRITGAGAVIAIEREEPDAFAQALARLLKDQDAWRRAAELAKRRGSELQWPAQAATLADAYPTAPRDEPVSVSS